MYNDKQREWSRKSDLKRRGAVNTPEQLVRSGQCEICQEYADPLCLDHDHATGEFRGWLCVRCNAGCGMFRDRPELCALAAIYLDEHS